MYKKLFSLLILVLTVFGVSAQDWPDASQVMSLPLNPKVKSGKLDNGLSYYILHNEEPKGKANFYIAQKVGSSLEEPNQLGLAHFLEHMAFNGTKNYPGKNLLDYLQLKGIRFGYDINAGTGYDQTVYNINNVSTADKNLMDSVLLALYDWSCGILLETSEIEAERGVIREEMRVTETANQRMINQISPIIFKEYPYQHPIIGTEDVIMNFTPDDIRAYYKKWYRPDLQGIVIVGDFNADEMEAKVVKLFSSIKMPENPAQRVYATVSDNEQPIYTYFSDPEMNANRAYISFKKEPVPFEIRNSMEMYMGNVMVHMILTRLFNYRLSEFAYSPQCAYSNASVNFSNYWFAVNSAAFNVNITAKTNIQESVAQAMSIVAQACKTGFTESEYDRVKEELLALLQNNLNEKDKTDNNDLGMELCDFFLENNPAPGIEIEYQIWQSILPMLTVDILNEEVADLLTSDNMVVVVAQPQGDDVIVAAEDIILGSIDNAMNAEYEEYEDESIDEPLIASLPQPGKISKKENNDNLGTITYTLSNGATVVIKPTDFSGDEILFSAYRKGGKQAYEASQADNVLMVGAAYLSSKMGPFDQKTLKRYLAGKKVVLSFDIDDYSDQFSGSSTVKDLPTLMELIYTSFTNLQPDQTTYNSTIDRNKPLWANMQKNPQYIFAQACQDVVYGNNPFMSYPTVEIMENANYDRELEIIKKALNNAADFTFIFTGNVDDATISPLLEQYIATLPSGKVEPVKAVTPIAIVKGQLKKEFQQPMQTPQVSILNIYSGYNVDYDTKNFIMTSMVGELGMAVFLETLREDEGGTYSPSVFSTYDIDLKAWLLQYQVETAPEKYKGIMQRADKELENLFANGTDASHFNKIKEANIQQYQNLSRNNAYWNKMLKQQLMYPGVDIISNYEAALNSITLEDFNNFIKHLYNGDNRIQVIMEGVGE